MTGTSSIATSLPKSARRNGLLCCLLTGACLLASFPLADVPFGDDFSYTHTALDFARSGHIVYNGWATAMLGWQILWGALFIKLLGFSFNVVRLSTLPLAMASVYLFHQILVRFGISSRDAVIGALTLGLSPLFFMVATTYLTDVPGLFIILLCLYMCQRAVLAQSTRAALLWLIFAAILNIIGGTVRQTSWLGTLIMVPCTAWLLRKQRGILAAASATTALSLVAIVSCLQWAKHQPFFVPEPFYIPLRYIYPLSIPGQYIKAFLCLVLVLSPVIIGWLPCVSRLRRAAILRLAALSTLSAIAVTLHARHSSLDKWLAPWLIPFLQLQALVISRPLRIALSLFVPVAGLVVAESIFASSRDPAVSPIANSRHGRAALWLVGPFALGYLVVLLPRAAVDVIQDRYLLVVMPSAIVLLLILYERWGAPHLPSLSIAVLATFAFFTIAATHDFYANLRAAQSATRELLDDGVPRTAILQGFAPDLWEQIQVAGYVNSWNMVSASTYYNPHVPPWPFPEDCVGNLPRVFEPALHPRYFIGYAPGPCFAETKYQPIAFRAWLPPFRRGILVQRILTYSER